MTGFITNYIQNTAMGMLSSGITAAGNVAGNAVGGVGTMIQSSGQAVGNGTNLSCSFSLSASKLTKPVNRHRRQYQKLGRLHQQLRRPRSRSNSTKPWHSNSSEKAKSPPSTSKRSRCCCETKGSPVNSAKSPSCSCIKAKDIGCKHAILRRSRKETRSLCCIQAESRGQRQSHPLCKWLDQTLHT